MSSQRFTSKPAQLHKLVCLASSLVYIQSYSYHILGKDIMMRSDTTIATIQLVHLCDLSILIHWGTAALT